MNKPFEIRYVEAKDIIVNAINSARTECGVSYIFIDTIIQDLARQVSQKAKNELKQCYETYNEYIKTMSSIDRTNNEEHEVNTDNEENTDNDEEETF